ncbi:2-nitropropane dioxygenase NPD [Bdellovibrio bacteriovorus W]|nr:2-nitropropane dioxygenase NPD [Bdellovibrio bacteriovorus W]
MQNQITELFNIEIPLLLAPMAGAADSAMAMGVAKAGGLGSIACAMLSEESIRNEVAIFRKACPRKPLNLNFFCHQPVEMSSTQENIWLEALDRYYKEFHIDPTLDIPFVKRKPFDESTCQLLEDLRPEVASFHFGLPAKKYIRRMKNVGIKIISSATTLEEALWLEEHGCDAIIAQGVEAGGHRGMFLTEDLSTQTKTFSLVSEILKHVQIPVIAAGGIVDAMDIKKFMALGASGVQLGTAYLLTQESKVSPLHRKALLSERRHNTVITNVFTGKPARSISNRLSNELGPMSPFAPPFPYAGKSLSSLKAASEKVGSSDFMSLWCGENLNESWKNLTAEELTRLLSKVFDDE